MDRPHLDKASFGVSLDEEARLALQRAVTLLSVRGLPTEELRRRLARRYTPEAVEAALAALVGSPFLDDRAWASAYVAGTRGRERSTALLRRELRAKGVGAIDAAAAVEEHDDTEAALAAARRRVRSLGDLDPAVRTRRLRDYLLRRGFASGAVRAAMEAVLTTSDDA
jgi:SOS response regulatory protein OraA/RecX